MSYVPDSTDVVFECPPEPHSSASAADTSDSASDREPLYVTPYETFNVDTAGGSRSVTYGGVMDKSTDTMAAVYGSASLEEGGDTGNVYAEASGRAELGAEDSDSESDSDSDSEDDDDDETHRSFGRSGRLRQTKNWNEEFQQLLGLPPSAEKFNKLARLAHDFVFAASTYGKIIISELGLPVEKKTIKPIAVGGQAGGEKYIVQGIFFKFALDIFGIYGGDEYAMKAASHDLKGLIHYYSCQIPGLHVPLMALIDYLGFRLIAITILPINAQTIKYGSSDAGATIHCEDPLLNAMMKKAARKMRLRGHFVGTPEGLGKKIYGPVDIEAHKGTDDRYYVVDFARTFPPERPSPQNVSRKGIVLYNLLRPELVKSNSVPLSSDAFTVWARADSKKDLYNLHVTQATERLFKEVIPEVAAKLNQLQESEETGKTHLDLIEVLHSAGVNVRHLGHIRQLVNAKLQHTLLIEMIARIVRKQIAEKFRKKTREVGIPTEEPQKLAAVKHLNKLLGRHRNSSYYWRSLKRALLQKFSKCLLDAELVEGYDLRSSLDLVAFFKRLRVLSPNTIPLTDEAAKDFARAIKDSKQKTWGEWIPTFKFLLSDMTALHATVKHMNLIDIAEASAMFYSSLEEKGYDQSRLLVQGLGKFQIASRKMPFLDVDTIILLGDMLVAQAQAYTAKNEGKDEIALLLSNALIAYQTALNIEPTNTKCILGVGNIYVSRDDCMAAISTYEEALRIDPTMAQAYLQLAKAHKARGMLSRELADVVERNLRKALEIDPDYYDVLYMLGDLLLTRYYTQFKQWDGAGGPELDDEGKRILAEVGSIYTRTLAIKDDHYPFIATILDIVTAEKPKTFLWSDLSLTLMWTVGESSPAFLQLLCNKLATINSLHMRKCRGFLTDTIFRGLAWASSSIHTLYITENQIIQESTVLDWLKQHPVPLLGFTVRQCPQFSDALLRMLASLPHAYSLVTLGVEGLLLTRECLLESFAPNPPAIAGIDAPDLQPALTPDQTPAANEHVEEEKEKEEKEEEKKEEEQKEEKEEKEEEKEEKETKEMTKEEKEMEEMRARSKEDRWGNLATLLISQIPDVDDRVIEVVSTLPSLTTLEYSGCSAVTSQSLACLPGRLTKAALGGGASIQALFSLSKVWCSSLTHLSLKGITGLSPQDQFKVAPLLTCLKHYQVPSGSVYLFSGTETMQVRYEDHGMLTKFTVGGKELYKFRTQPRLVMEGEDLSLTITPTPVLRLVMDQNISIMQVSFTPNVGWSPAPRLDGIVVPRLLQFMPMTKTFVIMPNQCASINYMPQQGTALIQINRGVNITTLLLLIYLAIYHKG